MESIGVSTIQRRPSEFKKSAYNCCSAMTCDGQANLGLGQSIRKRAHGHLRDDSFCGRCWDNRDAHAGIDERDECRHLSCRLDHLRDDSSVAQNSSQKIMETRSVLSCVHDKWIPFEFAQTNLFLCCKRVPRRQDRDEWFPMNRCHLDLFAIFNGKAKKAYI